MQNTNARVFGHTSKTRAFGFIALNFVLMRRLNNCIVEKSYTRPAQLHSTGGRLKIKDVLEPGFFPFRIFTSVFASIFVGVFVDRVIIIALAIGLLLITLPWDRRWNGRWDVLRDVGRCGVLHWRSRRRRNRAGLIYNFVELSAVEPHAATLRAIVDFHAASLAHHKHNRFTCRAVHAHTLVCKSHKTAYNSRYVFNPAYLRRTAQCGIFHPHGRRTATASHTH